MSLSICQVGVQVVLSLLNRARALASTHQPARGLLWMALKQLFLLSKAMKHPGPKAEPEVS